MFDQEAILKCIRFYLYSLPLLAGVLLLSGCPSSAGNTRAELGTVQNTVGEQTQDQLISCKVPLGVAALVEDSIPGLTQVGLPSPVPLLRLMMVNSRCFQVVDRGPASTVMRKERQLLKEGELQEGSGPASGQMVAADYLITPNIIFQDQDAGGHSFQIGLGGLASGVLGLLGAGIDTTNIEAQTLLTLTNVRTGVQEVIAEGSARKQDANYGIGAIGLASFGLGAGLSAYEDTDIGKLTAFAFQDAYNKLITSLSGL